MPVDRDSPTLPDHVRAFLDAPRFATLATAGADGRPNQSVVWYRLEPDGTILVNSRAGRRWPADLERDPRVSLAVIDPTKRSSWVGIGGEVVDTVDDVAAAREDIVALAHQYHPEGPDAADIAAYRTQPRVSFRIRISAVHDHLGD